MRASAQRATVRSAGQLTKNFLETAVSAKPMVLATIRSDVMGLIQLPNGAF